jgi:RNA polymerase sigma factor (TIGR02999 family)
MPTPAELLPLVYDELRRLAAAKLAREAPGHTLDATALVHEAFVKLSGGQSFATEGDYLRAAAVAMRRILVDHARRRNATKRGSGRQRVDLDLDRVAAPDPDLKLQALDESLERLEREHPQIAELVTLRHFVRLTIPEAASVLKIAPRTADSWWAYARAWLAADMAAQRRTAPDGFGRAASSLPPGNLERGSKIDSGTSA